MLELKIEREIEKQVGIEIYSTPKIEGIGGEYKCSYKDFIVKEITSEHRIIEIKEDSPPRAFSEELKDRYTTFNLIKVNTDTFDAIRKICKGLNISPDLISFSGIKDKCAISVQKVSIKGDFIEALQKLKIKDLFFRDIHPTRKPVLLGSNWGNHFTIVIRNIEPKENLEEKISQIIKEINKNGFPNYYGLQRFGYFRPNSHLVGKALMKGDFKEAFNQFMLTIYPFESEKIKEIRRDLKETGDFKKAYEQLPKKLFHEREVIKHLIEYPDDYQGAFGKLQKQLYTLFISSYQSYLFNKAISLRVKKNIPLSKPVKGDVICLLDDDNGHLTQVMYIYGNWYDKYLEKALELNRATIVAPIIGFGTKFDKFPLMKELYEEIFKEENIDYSFFKNYYKSEAEGKGTVRAIFLKPTGLTQFSLQDDDLNPGKKKLRIEFSLKKGSYATMLIREIMK
ncbi:MAG: tRNA pseudouridine(13) synthase TruD [Promethearchaeia archaeon]